MCTYCASQDNDIVHIGNLDTVDLIDFQREIVAAEEIKTCWEMLRYNLKRQEFSSAQMKLQPRRQKSILDKIVKDIYGDSKFVNAVFQLGLPAVCNKDVAAEHVFKLVTDYLTWIRRVGDSKRKYQQSDDYQDAVQRSGVQKYRSGLTPDQTAQRQEKRDAQRDLRQGFTLLIAEHKTIHC